MPSFSARLPNPRSGSFTSYVISPSGSIQRHTYTMNAVALNVSLAPRVRVAPKAAAKPARAVSPPSPRGAPATIFPTRAAIISRK